MKILMNRSWCIGRCDCMKAYILRLNLNDLRIIEDALEIVEDPLAGELQGFIDGDRRKIFKSAIIARSIDTGYTYEFKFGDKAYYQILKALHKVKSMKYYDLLMYFLDEREVVKL